MSKNIIYYFTGTGNTLSIARQIAVGLGSTDLLPIMTLQKDGRIPAEYLVVGFALPTCFLHPPKVVMQIGAALSFAPGQRIFILATCGGYNGFVLSDFRRLLRTRTQAPIQEFQVRMPGNHLVGFCAWKDSTQRRLFAGAARKVPKIVETIKNGASTWEGPSLPVGVMTWMSETYNRHLGVKDIHSTRAEFYTTDACVHCGICERICPVGNIQVTDSKVAFGGSCQQCMACIQWCPQHAIGHPNVPMDRKRYHNPDVTLQDMMLR